MKRDELIAQLDEAGYRPINDPVLDAILVDCPNCHAQDGDDLGMYRPARIVPRGRRLLYVCNACGATRG